MAGGRERPGFAFRRNRGSRATAREDAWDGVPAKAFGFGWTSQNLRFWLVFCRDLATVSRSKFCEFWPDYVPFLVVYPQIRKRIWGPTKKGNIG